MCPRWHIKFHRRRAKYDNHSMYSIYKNTNVNQMLQVDMHLVIFCLMWSIPVWEIFWHVRLKLCSLCPPGNVSLVVTLFTRTEENYHYPFVPTYLSA